VTNVMRAQALLGTLWHDPDDGASVWIAGEMFVIAQTGVTWFGAYLGATARHHGDRSTSRGSLGGTVTPKRRHTR